ncbi:MAG: LysR family transcriptional regulator [Spirochaetia bacterium]|jgi:DNA-binding transcriptional LysR family regulator|nr:LysR family transcriptional regulator [Spirochaetia bacterium]
MNDRQIHYILTIAETGSIRKAAEKLFISQPSLSQMLINIEKRYGVTFFDRSTNPMTLTYAGEKYIESIREIQQIEHRLIQQFAEISDSRAGRLSLGITYSKGLYILPIIIPEFHKSFPNIELEIIEGTNLILEDLLLTRRIDMAVLNYTSYHQMLEYVDLPEEEMLLAIPPGHSLVKQYQQKKSASGWPSMPIQEIAHEPFIYLATNHGVRVMVDSIFTSVGIHPPKAMETSNNTLAHKLVAAGIGITILPDNFIRHVLTRRNCRYFSISNLSFRRKVAICYQKVPPISGSMQSLVQLIQKKMSVLHNLSTKNLQQSTGFPEL